VGAQEACLAAARWRRLQPDLTVTVDVSPRQVADPGFVGSVRRALLEAGLPSRALVLGVGGVVLRPGDEAGRASLEELARLDVALSVDDVGTGCSTLPSLRRLPVQELTVDPSLVRGVGEPEGAALVGAIAGLARALGLRCVAAGVESAPQAAALAELGCSRAHGDHVSPPLTEPRLTELLGSGPAVAGPRVPGPREAGAAGAGRPLAALGRLEE